MAALKVGESNPWRKSEVVLYSSVLTEQTCARQRRALERRGEAVETFRKPEQVILDFFIGSHLNPSKSLDSNE
jgi:hypothetical protein